MVVYNADTASADQLRSVLDTIPGMRIVDEITDAGAVVSSIDKFGANLVLANLDPTPDDILRAVSSAAKSHSSTAFFAASARNDAQLILTAMRSGFSEFVRLPDESTRLAEAIETLRSTVLSDGSRGQIISTFGSAGGVGCTTLAVNLAVELADKCKGEVVLVDLDFLFGHVAMMLDVEIQHSLADLCGEGKVLDERVVQKAVMKHKSNVHVIARPREFEDTGELTAESCCQLLHLLQQMYPYVVLDGPGRFDGTGQCILDIADWNLLVVQPLVTAVRNAKRVLQALEKCGFDKENIQVVCNRSGGGGSDLNIQRLEKSLGHKFIACIPDDWKSVSEAINLGEPLLTNAPNSKSREAIRALADTIYGGATEADKGEGLFGRLFGRSKGGTGDSSVDKQTA